jgi:hypothetical protein
MEEGECIGPFRDKAREKDGGYWHRAPLLREFAATRFRRNKLQPVRAPRKWIPSLREGIAECTNSATRKMPSGQTCATRKPRELLRDWGLIPAREAARQSSRR